MAPTHLASAPAAKIPCGEADFTDRAVLRRQPSLLIGVKNLRFDDW